LQRYKNVGFAIIIISVTFPSLWLINTCM
jgi:hypothetical protein